MFQSWPPAVAERAAAPAYPCLIDERHSLAESFGIINVATTVWIDETGTIVRPAESPGSTDGFRSMNLATREIPADRLADTRVRRQIYLDALHDWIDHGPASQHVLSPDEVRRRTRGFDHNASLATAHFRLGIYLAQHNERDASQHQLEIAVQLQPDTWSFRRQKIVLSDPALTGQFAATEEFWQAVHALGDRYYYPPTDMAGMPPPLKPR